MPFLRYPSGSCPCQVSLPFELRHFPAGSLYPLSRIEFVSYRLVVLLRLLPTPPHDDAVAVEYGPENVCPVGTFTLLSRCAYEPLGAGSIPRTVRTSEGPPTLRRIDQQVMPAFRRRERRGGVSEGRATSTRATARPSMVSRWELMIRGAPAPSALCRSSRLI